MTVAKLSELERTRRLDAEFFDKLHLRYKRILQSENLVAIPTVAKISDGNHHGISESFQAEGIPYYRGQDAVGHFFIEQSSCMFIPKEVFDDSRILRSHLKQNDVLLSIIGTIGETSIVSSSQPATCSCKLAILRPTEIRAEYLATFLRCSYGRSQVNRYTRGAVQMGLLLEDLDQIIIARFSTEFENLVAGTVISARQELQNSTNLYAQAEQTLLAELGLLDWRPPEPLSYQRKASEVLRLGRLDAQYFQPKFGEVETFLARQFDVEKIGQWGKVLKGQSTEYTDEGEGIPVVRSGDLNDLENESAFKTALPGQPLFLLNRGDVCISSIGFGSIGKVQVFDKPNDHATVSEVTVVRQRRVNPYYLHFFLRSPFGQMQIERYITGATGQLHLYPKDVEKIYVPIATKELQDKLQAMTHESIAARRNAKHLLERAKRAVEIAIEESEAAAMGFLDGNECISYTPTNAC